MLMVAVGGLVVPGCVLCVPAEEGPLTGLIVSLCSGKFVWDAMEWMTSSATLFSRTTNGPSTTSERVSLSMLLNTRFFSPGPQLPSPSFPSLLMCDHCVSLMFLIIFSTFFAALGFSPLAHSLFPLYESDMTHMLSTYY